ncbi:MAG TPA: glucosaminidase domain-containing protein [Candidatus Saccharimonadales bacterium]|jgi:hypothetical protein|nr:glucosaminidase domain-containing protein [Candidatus Saccharimonadales bacterium]
MSEFYSSLPPPVAGQAQEGLNGTAADLYSATAVVVGDTIFLDAHEAGNEPIAQTLDARTDTLRNDSPLPIEVRPAQPSRRQKLVASATIIGILAGGSVNVSPNDTPVNRDVCALQAGTAEPASSQFCFPMPTLVVNYENKLVKIPAPEIAPAVLATEFGPEHQKIIDSLDLPADKKEGLIFLLDSILKLRPTVKDINFEVMLAQGILESSYAQDDLAKNANNFFGIKKHPKDAWAGPTYQSPTKEQDSHGTPYATTALFRKYDTPVAGVQGYVDKIRSAAWYDDARAQAGSVDGYLAGLLNEPAYATDKAYSTKVLGVIQNNKLHELLSVTAPAVPQISVSPAQIHNTLEWQGKGTTVILDGNVVPAESLTPNQLAHVVETNLNGADLSPGGFEDYRTQRIVDVRGQIHDLSTQGTPEQKKSYKSFNGDLNGLGTPANGLADYKHFIWHETDTGSNSYHLDGVSFAHSIGQREPGPNGGLAVQYFVDRGGKTWLLTDARTRHAVPEQAYTGNPYDNHHLYAIGQEVVTTGIGDVSPQQFEACIYAALAFLIDGSHIQKGVPITDTVYQMVMGHERANKLIPGGHTDFPIWVEAPMRTRLVALAVTLGYTA